MPRKIRQLVKDLLKAGFSNRGGKGSHRNFEHPGGVRFTLSGHGNEDARPYQEKGVRRQIEASKKSQ